VVEYIFENTPDRREKSMRVSIALATFNGAPYLEQQLGSFQRQQRLPDELVVSDDASTDDTVSILESFAADAPFAVRIRRNPTTVGFAQNFGNALSMCTGDLVFLSDQDDYWFPTKIETIESIARTDARSQVFINDAELTDEDLNPTGLTKLGQIRSAWMSDDAFVQGSCVAVRRGFLDLILPIPPAPWGHDAWIVGFARGLGRSLVVRQVLQLYRRHSSNASQFIANEPRTLSRRRLLWERMPLLGATDHRGWLHDESTRTELFARRVRQLLAAGAVDREMAVDLGCLADSLTAKQAALQARLALLEKSRPLRIPPVSAMLSRGQYSHFAGVRTAGRDILVR
jgi:glycosyltransferase involved in cell wall biosynthesis